VATRRIWQELGVAAALGAAVGASPLTGDDLGPKLATGLVTAGVLLGWRLRRPPTSRPPQAVLAPSARPSLPLWGVALLYLALVTPTLAWLYHRWTVSVWVNNHGIFVPILVAYLCWSTLREDPEPGREESSSWGFLWLALGIALLVVDSTVRTGYLSVLGLIVTLPGLSLLLLGARRTRALRVPLAITLLAIPIPNSYASDLYLRAATASAVEPLLHLLGIPAFRQGTVIQMSHNTFVVSNACSGFATLYAAMAVAIVLACYADRPWRRWLLLLAAPPLALAANIARVLLLVLLTDGLGTWVIRSPLHPGSGVATFLVILVGLFAIAGRRPLRLGSR